MYASIYSLVYMCVYIYIYTHVYIYKTNEFFSLEFYTLICLSTMSLKTNEALIFCSSERSKIRVNPK